MDATPTILLGEQQGEDANKTCNDRNLKGRGRTRSHIENPPKRRRLNTPDTTEKAADTKMKVAPGGGSVVSEESIKETWGELYVMRTDGHGRAALREAPKFILPLLKEEYILGRSSKCDIQINLPQCSREHLSIKMKCLIEAEKGIRRYVYLEINKGKSVWKTMVNGKSVEDGTKQIRIVNGDHFTVCGRPFKMVISEIGDEHKFYNAFDTNPATADVSSVTNLSIEGRPPTIRKNKFSRKRKLRLRSEVNDSSIISESLIQSPLEGTPKDLKASFHKKNSAVSWAFPKHSFDNGGSFQGSFLLADEAEPDSKSHLFLGDESLASGSKTSRAELTPSPLPMPSPEQQPSAMKSTKHSVGVPTELNRTKAVRFGAFNEEAYIKPVAGRPCSVTPATKILPPHQSKSAQKRVQMGVMFTVGLVPSPQMPKTPAKLGLGLMKPTPKKDGEKEDVNSQAPAKWGQGQPKVYKVIEEIMKMPKARKPETLLVELGMLRAKVQELMGLVRSPDEVKLIGMLARKNGKKPYDQGLCRKIGSEIMKMLTSTDFSHPVMDNLKHVLHRIKLSKKGPKKFRGQKSSSKIKTLWDGIRFLQKNPGDVSTLRLEVVSCIVDKIPQSDLVDDMNTRRAMEECIAMFAKLGEATSTEVNHIPELVGKRLRQGLKRLVALEHHKAEEIIVQLSHKLKVTNRTHLPEVAEESIRIGLKELLRNPKGLAFLSPEHRNMAISSLSELVTIGSSSLTALLTSTSKELNSYGGHLDTNNAILVGISQIMARPQSADEPHCSPGKLNFTSFNQSNIDHHVSHASICEESTIIGTSALTPSRVVRRFRKGDSTPHHSKLGQSHFKMGAL